MVMVLDSTLREGEQTPGVYFPLHAKLAIARCLDAVGVDFLEAGHPAVDEEIEAGVKLLAAQPFNVTVGAHARVVQHELDQALQAGARFIGMFYCVRQGRLENVFKKSLPEALDLIAGAIGFIRERSPRTVIRFTPEDTVRTDFDRVVEVAAHASRSGAHIISIADTTGYMMPGTERSMYDYVRRLRDALAARECFPKIAVHCHNDRGLAVANAIDAYRGGADILDATVMGLGERTGIVDLAQLLTVISVDYGASCWNLRELPELYRLVSKYSGIDLPPHAPVIGSNAFTHCAGVHTHASIIDPSHYQSLEPSMVGRQMEIALDHMSGMASLRYAVDALGLSCPESRMASILREIKRVGRMGRTVDLEELGHVVRWHQAADAVDFIHEGGREVECAIPIGVKVASQDVIEEAMAVRVSRDGMLIRAQTPLRLGQPVQLRLPQGGDLDATVVASPEREEGMFEVSFFGRRPVLIDMD